MRSIVISKVSRVRNLCRRLKFSCLELFISGANDIRSLYIYRPRTIKKFTRRFMATGPGIIAAH